MTVNATTLGTKSGQACTRTPASRYSKAAPPPGPDQPGPLATAGRGPQLGRQDRPAEAATHRPYALPCANAGAEGGTRTHDRRFTNWLGGRPLRTGNVQCVLDQSFDRLISSTEVHGHRSSGASTGASGRDDAGWRPRPMTALRSGSGCYRGSPTSLVPPDPKIASPRATVLWTFRWRTSRPTSRGSTGSVAARACNSLQHP
jgi:hypothetical protein